MTHKQTDTAAPTGAVSVSATETPRVYALHERDSEINPFDAYALLGALLFLAVFLLALGLAGWIEAAL